MRNLLTACARNLFRATVTRSPWFDPVLPTLYVTPVCNLQCTYCADWGTGRNRQYQDEVPSLERLQGIVRLLRRECDTIYLTGGEPTMRPDILELLGFIRAQRFRYVAMNTNGLLLHRYPGIVDLVDNLVVSVDALDEGRDDPVLRRQPHRVARLFRNLRWAAAQQPGRSFVCTVTTVVRPGKVAEARRVMEFCFAHGLFFSIQHLTENSLASPELVRDREFPRFLDEMIAAKRAGRPVSGSEVYIRRTRELASYSCAPTAVPHVDHAGRLAYPCRELPGHVKVDLLAAGSLRQAIAEGARRVGAPPVGCSRCPDRCYVEASTLLRSPGLLVRETLSYLGQAAKAARAARAAPASGGAGA